MKGPGQGCSSGVSAALLRTTATRSRMPAASHPRGALSLPPITASGPIPPPVHLYTPASARRIMTALSHPRAANSHRNAMGEARHPISMCTPHSMHKRSRRDSKLTLHAPSQVLTAARGRDHGQPGYGEPDLFFGAPREILWLPLQGWSRGRPLSQVHRPAAPRSAPVAIPPSFLALFSPRRRWFSRLARPRWAGCAAPACAGQSGGAGGRRRTRAPPPPAWSAAPRASRATSARRWPRWPSSCDGDRGSSCACPRSLAGCGTLTTRTTRAVGNLATVARPPGAALAPSASSSSAPPVLSAAGRRALLFVCRSVFVGGGCTFSCHGRMRNEHTHHLHTRGGHLAAHRYDRRVTAGARGRHAR